MEISPEYLLNNTVFQSDFFFLTVNGKSIRDASQLREGDVVRLWPRLPGGKGGFGSLLRAMGNQISKTTNNDMCRDLTGRRIGDVNKEQKMKEWFASAEERRAQTEKVSEEKRKRRRALLENGGRPEGGPVVELRKFKRQKEEISASLQEALKEGKKRKLEESVCPQDEAKDSKKSKEDIPVVPKKRRWIDEEEALLDEVSDSEDDSLPSR